ncbi:MAG TPA: hypothetical protein VMW78_03760 [Anaerolineae bacterium]|nr:hypothetical protein [Anaerolineae bacterium]
MLYNLNKFELEKIAGIYKIDVNLLVEKLELQDDILDFVAFESGVKVETKSGQCLILRLKNRL